MQFYFASSSAIAIPIAEKLLHRNLLAGFLSNPDKPVGRNLRQAPNPFASWAEKTRLPIFKSSDTESIKDFLTTNNVDLVITCAFGLIIQKSLLQIPKLGWLNIHFSMLPKYRGAAPVQRAIMNGDTETGVSIFKLDEGIDTGMLAFQRKIKIEGKQKTTDVISGLSNVASEALVDLLRSPEDIVYFQQEGEPTFAPKISKGENEVDWNSNSSEIFNLYRALDLNGGLFTYFRGNRVDLTSLEPSEIKVSVSEIDSENGELLVGTKDGSIAIKTLKPQGKREMSAKEWINGARLVKGEKFG